jgi:membrane fusion protein, multidrug efflux system
MSTVRVPSSSPAPVPIAASPTAAMPAERPPASSVAPSRRRPLYVVAVVGAMVGLAAIGYSVATAGQETTDDAFIEADIVSVQAEVGGRVTEILAHTDQAVAVGDVLLKLDARELDAKVAAARAELAIAEAEVHVAEAQAQIAEATAAGGLDTAKAQVVGSTIGVKSAFAQIETARAMVDRARTDAEKTALDLSRSVELLAHQSVPREEVDHARLADAAARSAVAQAEANLDVAEQAAHAARSRVAEAKGKLLASAPVGAQIEAVRASVALARARVEAARAALSQAELQLSYTIVTAPAAGLLSKVAANPGELIDAKQGIAEIVPRDMYVVANYKETQLADISPGKSADISLDAYPGHPLHGTVASLSGATGARFSLLPPDNASGNFVKVVQRVPVRIAIHDAPADIPLRAGLSAEVTVHLDSNAAGHATLSNE